MRKALFLILILIALSLLAGNKWYWKNETYKLSSAQSSQLERLGETALANGDMPIAALLVYNNDVIAKGYNDVIAHNNITGHAEINAIGSVIRAIGLDSFNKLNRNNLFLITTWEPCYMCSGAIIQYNIQHVVVVKTKSRRHWWNQWKKKESYEWNIQISLPDTLQDYLFKKHPQYEKQKSNL